MILVSENYVYMLIGKDNIYTIVILIVTTSVW